MEKAIFQSSREVLQFNYDGRKEKNPRFSKRAFARMLGISPGRVTELLNGKSHLTEKKARALLGKLGLSAEEKIHFLLLVENETLARSRNRTKSQTYRMNFDEFALISDWEYFSLMSLIETSNFKSDKKWIADKLGISRSRLQEVLNNLQHLNFIKIDEDGKISNTYRSMSTLTDIPSEVLKKANIDCIMQAVEKINEVDTLARDVTSMTFPVAPQKIQAAKSLIRKFKSQMAELMTGQETTEIYNLNIQLVPVSQLGV